MENWVSHNPQGLLWEELLKRNRLTLHRRIWHCHFSLYSAGVFLNKSLKALSTRHLFCDVLSIFRNLPASLFVADASGHWCLLLWSHTHSVWPAPTWRIHHGAQEPDRQGHCPPTGPEEDLRPHPLPTDKLELYEVWRKINYSKWSGKKVIDYKYISKPWILYKKQTKQNFSFFLLGFLMMQ